MLVGSGGVLVWESVSYGGLGRGEMNNTKGWYRYRLGTWGKQGGQRRVMDLKGVTVSVRQRKRKKEWTDVEL